ncbi:MAG: hypothetical protein D6737_07545 [Chloroflexi bacterium]|nr:MAG: hypothetical protein CUN54_06940 [Phototrophicales bacterium]RMF80600.1 MAG: hypothetical protein D6737_07545 [Chloroflexota bacterium]
MEILTLPFILSVISAVVSGIFAAIVLRRWYEKRRPHLMAWGIGLALYFAGTLSQVILALTWSPFFFGLWYWSGGIVVAAWLGQGTIYLLVRRGNWARNIQMLLLLISLMTLPWTLFLTDFDSSHWEKGVDVTQIYKDVMPPFRGSVRAFAPMMNTWGTIALVGGAIYSARLFRRKQIMRNRVVGNWLIATGALFPAVTGTLILLDNPSFKYFGEMMGAILIFAGFLMATTIPEDEKQPREPRLSTEASGN